MAQVIDIRRHFKNNLARKRMVSAFTVEGLKYSDSAKYDFSVDRLYGVTLMGSRILLDTYRIGVMIEKGSLDPNNDRPSMVVEFVDPSSNTVLHTDTINLDNTYSAGVFYKLGYGGNVPILPPNTKVYLGYNAPTYNHVFQPDVKFTVTIDYVAVDRNDEEFSGIQ